MASPSPTKMGRSPRPSKKAWVMAGIARKFALGRRSGQVAGVVPELEQVAAVALPQDAEGGRIQVQPGARLQRQLEEDDAQHAQEVPVAEDYDRGGAARFQGLEKAGRPASNVLRRLAARAAVAPEVPVRALGVDLAAGDALVVAVVPLHQQRFRGRVREAGEDGGAARPLVRAAEDGVEPLAGQP